MISKLSVVPYIENVEQMSGHCFQSFEAIETDKQGKDVNQVVAKIMKNNGFKVGKGLGARLQGIKEPINLMENPKRQGLGYEPSLETLMNQHMRLSNDGPQRKKEIPHIKDTFPHASETFNPSSSVAMADDEERKEECKGARWIQLDVSDKAPDNWESETIPDVVSLE